MVPQFRPQAALHMIDRLINRQALSPLLPTNATLLELSEEDFEKTMNDWTTYAKTMPRN